MVEGFAAMLYIAKQLIDERSQFLVDNDIHFKDDPILRDLQLLTSKLKELKRCFDGDY